MCEEKDMLVLEKIGDYKKEAKRFVKGLVKSKLFRTETDGIEMKIIRGDFDKKTKMGKVTLAICDCAGMGASYTVMATTRVYNKIDVALFEQLVEQLAKIKNFGGLTVIE
jgi:hypothetical protein